MILLSLVCHEIGHARSMLKVGIKIEEMGIGIPIRGLPYLRLKSKKLGFDLCFHLLLLGAYVKSFDSEEKKIEALPYKDFSLIMGAGVRANMLFYCLLFLGMHLVNGSSIKFLANDPFTWVTLGILIVSAPKRFFCNYMMLIFGPLMIGLIVYSFYYDPANSLTGPIGIAKIVGKFSISFATSLSISAIFSGCIGLMNALPLFPLDGGRIIDYLCGRINRLKNYQDLYRKISIVLFAVLIIAALTSDFINL
ncbi:MAG: M50 family metallopeptidase [Patescibacteria group bacterium]